MPSSFKSLDLFGSGPHRFIEGAAGQEVVTNLRLGISLPGVTTLGDAQLIVTVRGRLVAADHADLWSQIDAIKTALADWATPGALIDCAGHEWPSINFLAFTPADRIDRARAISLAYTALFAAMP